MLSEINLSEFKCFGDSRLDFGGLTVLAGVNGAGKSTVLQALLLLHQSAVNGQLRLNGDCVRLGGPADVLREDAAERRARVSAADASGETCAVDLDFRDAGATTLGTVVRTGSVVGTPGLWYLNAERVGPRAVFPYRREYDPNGPLGRTGEFTAQHLAQNWDAHVDWGADHGHPRQEGKRLGDRVSAWMTDVSPGVRVLPAVDERSDSASLRFGFQHAGAVASDFRSTHVGFGLTYGLPVVVAACGLPRNGLLLVENPEAHLHPMGQSQAGRLLAYAAANERQVVVETHSDHLLNGLRLAVAEGKLAADRVRIHYFTRGAAGEVLVTSPILEQNGQLSAWPPGFFDQIEVDLAALAKARRVRRGAA